MAMTGRTTDPSNAESAAEGQDTIDGAHSMTLSHLLDGVIVTKLFQTMYGQMVVTHDVEVSRIQYDSRKVRRNDLFVAISGTENDGHAFIEDAIGNGAKVVVMENDTALPDSFFMHAGVVKVVVPESRMALARIAANYFGHPAASLALIGVTGTNGKTTTTNLVQAILAANGEKSGLIGTIEYAVGDTVIPATHTTPESLELNDLLSRMVRAECSSAVMEVSSHALDQHRVEGFGFRVAVFTNLTQDHLDYHGSMEEYFGAKRILFEHLDRSAWAVVNCDDPWGKRIIGSTHANVLTYGIDAPADVRASDVSLSMTGTQFTAVSGGERTQFTTSLVGRFNVYNVLAAIAVGRALGYPTALIQRAVQNMKCVPGRFERVLARQGWSVIIDYAHTPDALEKALKAVHDVFAASVKGRIITVFGCGGNRDRTKRPKMAKVATELSDITIVTSDNPRQEDPGAIIDEIMGGVSPDAVVYREADRKKAIIMALGMAMNNDVVLLAGKGHEDYQVIGSRKIHFSDREIVDEYLKPDA
jgi:UDP-N-acetylmuramoyl-L-alanyl-D-glutamate--2,6-diaminopimelate ligase